MEKKEYQKEYFQRNKEKLKEYQKEYQKEYGKRDYVKSKNREYQQKNKNKNKEYHKEYYQRNKEKCKVYNKEYNKEYCKRDYAKRKKKEYYENNKERLIKESKIRHIKNKYNLDYNVYKKITSKCSLCGFDKYPADLHHIDKDKKNNNLKNLTGLCSNCHMAIHRGYIKLNSVTTT